MPSDLSVRYIEFEAGLDALCDSLGLGPIFLEQSVYVRLFVPPTWKCCHSLAPGHRKGSSGVLAAELLLLCFLLAPPNQAQSTFTCTLHTATCRGPACKVGAGAWRPEMGLWQANYS